MEEKRAVPARGEIPAAKQDGTIRQRAVDSQSELQSFILLIWRFVKDVAPPIWVFKTFGIIVVVYYVPVVSTRCLELLERLIRSYKS